MKNKFTSILLAAVAAVATVTVSTSSASAASVPTAQYPVYYYRANDINTVIATLRSKANIMYYYAALFMENGQPNLAMMRQAEAYSEAADLLEAISPVPIYNGRLPIITANKATNYNNLSSN